MNELEDFCVRHGDMASSLPENQIMIHKLNDPTLDCVLQPGLLERRTCDKAKSLTVEEIRVQLSLRFGRSNIKCTGNENGEESEEFELSSGQIKNKCRNCRKGWE
jgi:hypothetical protein